MGWINKSIYDQKIAQCEKCSFMLLEHAPGWRWIKGEQTLPIECPQCHHSHWEDFPVERNNFLLEQICYLLNELRNRKP